MSVQISVALVTRNRPDSLRRTLTSLREQLAQPQEVVVSDDSDDAYTADVARVAKQFDARYVQGPRKGLYANRNHVALACNGTHIRTMDDDHEFPPQHFDQVYHAVQKEPNVVWAVGEYLPSDEPKTIPPPCPGQLHAGGFSYPPVAGQPYYGISDGAGIYPRFIFDKGERYYDQYLFGAAYLEFGSRLHWKGVTLKHLTETYVIHHYEGADSRSWAGDVVEYGSRFFAMLCHSFIYDRTVTNKAYTVATILRSLSAKPRLYRHCFLPALHASDYIKI